MLNTHARQRDRSRFFAFTSNYVLVTESCSWYCQKFLHIHVTFHCTNRQKACQNICSVYKVLYVSCYILLHLKCLEKLALLFLLYIYMYISHIHIYVAMIIRLIYAYCLCILYVLFFNDQWPYFCCTHKSFHFL